MLLTGCAELFSGPPSPPITLDSIPEFDGKTPYVEINENVPFFDGSEDTENGYEKYTPLDSLGRCGVAMAHITKELMPTDDRGEIGSVYPSGWQSVQYDIVSGKYLYNRSHLIGFQLTGENANKENLITGTRFFNVEGMLPFENMVADHIKETDGSVLYRVTPIFKGNELVARGVLMEALSIGETPEENGEDIEFCVYVYNNQPGITIDYATGKSALGTKPPETDGGENEDPPESTGYILNTKTHKFHKPSCSGVNDMKPENKAESNKTRDELMADGYDPCGTCKP